MAHPARHEADVIIVGAGISGMIAARKVLEAGLTPLVLEADERVGGRLLTPRRSWIGDTHQRMFQLSAEHGVETYPQYVEGQTSYEVGGCGVLRENEFHSRFALRRLDVLAADVPVEARSTRASGRPGGHRGRWRRDHARQEISMLSDSLTGNCTLT